MLIAIQLCFSSQCTQETNPQTADKEHRQITEGKKEKSSLWNQFYFHHHTAICAPISKGACASAAAVTASIQPYLMRP